MSHWMAKASISTGRFEFLLERGNKRICIVEAKSHDIWQGLTQDLLGIEAVADVERLNCVYGIVTDYVQWFVKSLDNRIEVIEGSLQWRGNQTPTKESIEIIAGFIYAILLE